MNWYFPSHVLVKAIKASVHGIPIIANGNVKSFADVEKNRAFTGSDGIMSAEGILDDPALFAVSFILQLR